VGVNLRTQTVVAYEGDTPVYAALAATGMAATPTVRGVFRTWWRLVSRKMSGGAPATGGYYYLEEVPWTLYFYSGYALHAAYWHDAFGRPRSHGCVNLSPYDAWWIFKWSEAGGPNSPAVYVYWE
jgi:lipoprotein-anchoring transpeptidase ErfK/SrfK